MLTIASQISAWRLILSFRTLYTCTYDSITWPFTYSNFHFWFYSSTRVRDKVLDRVLE